MKRRLSLLLIILVLAQSITVSANPGNTHPSVPQSAAYTSLIASDYYSYCITAQSNEAIPLNANVTLTDAEKCTSYTKNVFRLPTLKSGYFYTIDHPASPTTYDCYLAGVSYPALECVGDFTTQKSITMHVNSPSGIQATFVLKITLTSVETAGVTEPLTAAITDSTSFNCYALPLAYFNEKAITNFVITKDFVYVPTDMLGEYGINSNVYVKDGKLYSEVDDLEVTKAVCTDVTKNLAGRMRTTGSNVSLYNYMQTTPTDKVIVVSNKLASFAEVSAVGNLANTSNSFDERDTYGFYMTFNQNKINRYIVANASRSGSVIDTHYVDMSANIVTVPANTTVPLQTLTGFAVNHIVPLSAADSTVYTASTAFLNDRPVNTSSDVTLTQGTSAGLAVLSFIGDSYVTSAIIKTDTKPTYTMSFQTNGGTACNPQTIATDTKVSVPTTTRVGYTFGGWYTDSNLLSVFDPNSYAVTPGGNYTIYAKWTVNPAGTYTVTWYDFNEVAGTTTQVKSVQTYDVGTQPVNPANPANSAGKVFKTWAVLPSSNTTSIATVRVAPEYTGTWLGTSGSTYNFVAKYTMSGVITSVVNSNSATYTNKAFDKSSLTVTGLVDGSYNPVTLPNSSWTISPSSWNTPGTKNATVTYNATGATYPVQIVVTQDVLESITASYTGSTLNVGASIPKTSISVIGTYLSGNKVAMTDFSINPDVVKYVGSNTIAVTAGGKACNITVKGVAAPSSSESTLSVSYIGTTKKVGDSLTTSDFNVYSVTDGASKKVTSFTFTPSKVTAVGSTKVTVTAGGLTQSVYVPVIAASTTSTGDKTTTKPVAPSKTSASGTGTSTSNSGTETVASVGYLSGRTILNTALDKTLGTNNVDALAIVQSASKTASSLSMQLYNDFEDTTLEPAVFAALQAKKLDMSVTMLNSVNDKIIGVWKFTGGAMTSSNYEIDCALGVESLNKTNDISYAVTLAAPNYPTGTSLKLNVADQFQPGSVLYLYATDSTKAGSRFLSSISVGEDGYVDVPIQGTQYLVFSNNNIKYKDGSDLTRELTEVHEVVVSDNTVSVNEIMPPKAPEETPETQPVEQSTQSKTPIVILLVSVVLLSIGALAWYVLRGKIPKDSTLTDDVEEADFLDEDE